MKVNNPTIHCCCEDAKSTYKSIYLGMYMYNMCDIATTKDVIKKIAKSLFLKGLSDITERAHACRERRQFIAN